MLVDLTTLPPMLPIAPDPPRDLIPAPIDLERWRDEHVATITRAAAPSTWSATRVAGSFSTAHAVGETDANVGSGTARGRAVHWVLEQVDLDARAAGVDELAATAAAVEGLSGREREIADLSRSVLASDTLAEARTATRRWKELYVGAPVGDVVVEGYIDLLFERADGLVIVDYKTDAVDAVAGLDPLVERYGPQLASYAVALEAVAPDRVVEARLVVARPEAAIELTIGGERLRDLMAAVRSSLRSSLRSSGSSMLR